MLLFDDGKRSDYIFVLTLALMLPIKWNNRYVSCMKLKTKQRERERNRGKRELEREREMNNKKRLLNLPIVIESNEQGNRE